MNILVLFLILFLALAGMGTIWWITTPKCTLPVTNTCDIGSGKLPFCTDPDKTFDCVPYEKVCKDPPDTSKCDASTLKCNYNTQKWECTGNPGDSGKGTACTIKDGKLESKITGSDADFTPVYGYQDYQKITSGGITTCSLWHCNTSNLLTDGSWCQPTDAGSLNCNTGDSVQLSSDSYKTYPDSNVNWKIAYNAKDASTKYCAFSSCKDGTTLVDGACKKTSEDDDTFCTNWNKGVPATNGTWTKKADGSCYITCNTPDASTHLKYTVNGTTCVPSCINDGCKTYTLNGTTCTPNGCTSGCRDDTTGVMSNTDCTPSCGKGDPQTDNYYLLGTSKTTTDNKFNTQNQSGTGRCIPTRGGTDDYWGGCGSATDTTRQSYALSIDDDPTIVPTGCTQTIPTSFAKFSDGTDKSTRGCIQCQPKKCPVYAIKSKQCKSDEPNCQFTDYVDTSGTNVIAVDDCVTNSSDKKQLYEKWGTNTTVYDAYIKGNTTGRPIITPDVYNFQFPLITGGYQSDTSVEIDNVPDEQSCLAAVGTHNSLSSTAPQYSSDAHDAGTAPYIGYYYDQSQKKCYAKELIGYWSCRTGMGCLDFSSAYSGTPQTYKIINNPKNPGGVAVSQVDVTDMNSFQQNFTGLDLPTCKSKCSFDKNCPGIFYNETSKICGLLKPDLNGLKVLNYSKNGPGSRLSTNDLPHRNLYF